MPRSTPLKSVARLVLVAMLVSQPLQAAADDPPSYANNDIISMPAYGALGYQPALDRAPAHEAAVPRFDAMSNGGGGGY